jgi:hypothetical protein
MLNENCEFGPANILPHNYPMSNPAIYAGKFHHHAKIARAPFPFVSQSDIIFMRYIAAREYPLWAVFFMLAEQFVRL